jgi:2-octaprenylphenol hydroxylase
MTESCDIAIVGAGLVGSSLAAALAPSGLSVSLIEPRVPAAPAASWDSRIYAVSPGSAAFLESCGAWQALPAERIERIETMRIFGDAQSSRLEFNAYDAGLRELAFIVENAHLQHALWQRLQHAHHVRLYCPAACESIDWTHDAAHLRLADGQVLRARLIVGADGMDSWVRQQAGIALTQHDYHQLGVVANFAIERPHHGTAFQWFRGDSVLALLPLPGNRVSMVWSCDEVFANEVLALTPEALEQRVAEASGGALGALQTITPAAAFPLRMQKVAQLVKPRAVLVGDAAHTVHPLAGQGVNLGFRDARELAAVLGDRGAQHDCGDYALLRRYERARKEDVLAMQMATDSLLKLFASRAVWISNLRNTGLNLVEHLPLIKKMLIQQAIA